ncbi:PulJ/GspJ family protein [Burkholderia alba]|uniref:PulJ/GspJ family protein n=1 Tax=Burkholderia alba TaxID=2683677 RepID=UPI002B057C87|nr:prepilin-type N-terminal cleavage/methylation domain-containing protein [Burkholderia alba]
MKRGTDRRARGRAAGFTLIEMLVAITLLAVIALLSWRGLDATVRSRDDIATSLAQTRLLGRYFSQLQYDTLNLATADEVFGPPLRLGTDELVLVRHLGIGDGPAMLQVVRYRLKGRELRRGASQPVSSLSELVAALAHMDGFAEVVASRDVRSMKLAVWIAPGGWTANQAVVAASYADFLSKHGIGNATAVGMPVPRGIRFTVTTGSPPGEFERMIPIGQ